MVLFSDKIGNNILGQNILKPKYFEPKLFGLQAYPTILYSKRKPFIFSKILQ